MEKQPLLNALKNLSEEFPGRENQIAEIGSLIGEWNDVVPPLLLYGGQGTGKSSVVGRIFRYLNRPFSFVNCHESQSQRIIFESVVNQLMGHRRTRSNAYASFAQIENLPSFLEVLPKAVAVARETFLSTQRPTQSPPQPTRVLRSSPPQPKSPEPALDQGGGTDKAPTVYLVFDNAERFRESDWDLLGALLRAPELLRDPNVGVVLVSSLAWSSFRKGTGMREPLCVHFPEYSQSQLADILGRRRLRSPPHRPYLESVLPVLVRPIRSLPELAVLVEPLYEMYKEPIESGQVAGADTSEGRSNLFQRLKPHLGRALEDPFGSQFCLHPVQSVASLSLSAKFLLLAAFIASRNLPAFDSDYFDFGSGKGARRRRKVSVEQRVEREAKESLRKGPGSFPLERLLSIYRAILEFESENKVFHSSSFLPLLGPSRASVVAATNGRPPSGRKKRRSGKSAGKASSEALLAPGNVEDDSWKTRRIGDITGETLIQLATLSSSGLLGRTGEGVISGGAILWCRADGEFVSEVQKVTLCRMCVVTAGFEPSASPVHFHTVGGKLNQFPFEPVPALRLMGRRRRRRK